ncbi:hypothetical protein AVEN_229239-1 [Araneus ventricosus]|uniref:Uncharacterized protein n=1 Tax=Araneus ventricosus TaxID=182803 RepID=A0A4Y2XC51_ARAVE|nr:hypothetical protein AVEN_229239-1 [Araneus ventricosus]
MLDQGADDLAKLGTNKEHIDFSFSAARLQIENLPRRKLLMNGKVGRTRLKKGDEQRSFLTNGKRTGCRKTSISIKYFRVMVSLALIRQDYLENLPSAFEAWRTVQQTIFSESANGGTCPNLGPQKLIEN